MPIRIEFSNAAMLHENDDRVVIEFSSLEPVVLTNVDKIQMTDEDGSRPRQLTDDERRDLENALDEFNTLRMARGMARLMRRCG